MVKKTEGIKSSETKKGSNSHNKKFNFNKFVKKNYGLILSGVLAIIILYFLILGSSFCDSNSISKKDAGKTILNLFLDAGYDAQLKEVVWDEVKEMYLVSLIVEGREEKAYIGYDGKYFINAFYSINQLSNDFYSEKDFSRNYSNEELNSIRDFVSCLNDKKLKIYGVNYEKNSANLIALFGGRDIIEPIYVDCFWETDLCVEKNVIGFPSVILNDSVLGVEISFSDLSEKTNCSIDNLN